MDNRRICLYTLPPAQRWPRWVPSSGPWAPTSGAQPVLSEDRGKLRIMLLRPNTPGKDCPLAPSKIWKHAVWAADIIQFEYLVWAVFDNIMGTGEAPPLFGLETYSQVLGCLAGKVYKGQHMHCPDSNICLFWHRTNIKGKTWRPRTKKSLEGWSTIPWCEMWGMSLQGHIPLSKKGKTMYGCKWIINPSTTCGPKHS